jgi:hypothetical protein
VLLVRRTALVLVLATALTAVASRASAQEGPAGAVTASFLASPQEDFGASLLADLWFPIDVFRIGGFFGVGALPSGDDERNRVFMPLGVSAGLEILGERVGVSLRARGGIWGGATQEVKLTVGGFVGGGAYLLVGLGGGVAVSVGMDVWGLIGPGEAAVFAPGLGLTWTPMAPEP